MGNGVSSSAMEDFQKNARKKALNDLEEAMKRLKACLEPIKGGSDLSPRVPKFLTIISHALVVAQEDQSLLEEIVSKLSKLEIVPLLLQMLKLLSKDSTDYPESGLKLECYAAVQTLCLNACNSSVTFCDDCRKYGVLDLLRKDLKNLKSQFKLDLDTYGQTALFAMNILYNSVKSEDNVTYLKDLKIISLVKWYADNTHDLEINGESHFPVICAILLTYLAEEQDPSYFQTKDDVFDFLVEHLTHAAESKSLTFEGFSAQELATGLSRLSKNENNSRAIGRKEGLLDAIKLLLENKKTQACAAELLNNLAHLKENQRKILNHPTILIVLQNLWKETPNEQLQTKVALAISGGDSFDYPEESESKDKKVKESLRKRVQMLKEDVRKVQQGSDPEAEAMQQVIELGQEACTAKRDQPPFDENLADQMAYLGAPKILLDYMNALTHENKEYPETKLLLEFYEQVRNLLWNATDRSFLFCDNCGKCGIFSFLAVELRSLKDKFKKDPNRLGFFVLQAMSILQNCARSANSIPLLEKLNLVPLVKWYSENTPAVQIRNGTCLPTVCIILLAYIADEDEINKILANFMAVNYMIQNLHIALAMEDHSFEGFSSIELVAGLRKLAKNTENSIHVISNLQGFNVLPEILQNGTTNEKFLGLELVCQLAFTNENKRSILKNETLTKLVDSFANDNSNKELQNMAKLASFVLLDGFGHQCYSITSVSKEQPELITRSKSLNKNSRLVAISYQQDSHKLVQEMKKRLESDGYQIRLDVDQIGGNMLNSETIYDIEQACAVLICISRKYKDSVYCRAVAEYAYRCGGNDIITLMVEESCRPNGWLDFIIQDEENQKCLDLSRGYSNKTHGKILNFLQSNVSLICQCTDVGNDSSDDELTGDAKKPSSMKTIVTPFERVSNPKGFVDTSQNLRTEFDGPADSLQKQDVVPFVKSRVASESFSAASLSSRRASLKSIAQKHIFISYQHNQQQLIKKINEALKRSGYNTCVDYESTFADVLDFMVYAINNAAVVLICMSESYEKSENCRDEGVNARKMHNRDDIIPLLIEKGYQPKGWIDFMIGAKFYHDVTDGYGKEQHKKLVKQIGNRGKIQ